MKFKKPYLLLLMLVFFVIGCASAEPETVTVKVITLPFHSFSPFYIAIEEGYFAEQNIEVELIEMFNSRDVIPSLVSGQVDVSAGLVSAAIFNTVAQGGDIKIVADKGNSNPETCESKILSASKTLAESVDLSDPQNLIGRSLSVVPATWNEYLVDKTVEQVGLSLSDFELNFIPGPAALEAMNTGALDLGSNNEPWRTRHIAAGNVPILADSKDVLPGESSAIILYGPAMYKGDVGVRFMTAYLKAVAQYNEGPTDRNVEILAPVLKLEPEFLREICWQYIRADGLVDTNALMEFQDWAVDMGYIDSPVALDEIWDPSYSEAATK